MVTYGAKKNEEEVVPTKKKSDLKKYDAKKENLPILRACY